MAHIAEERAIIAYHGMSDKRACNQLPILNLVVLLLTLSVVGNNEDVLKLFRFKI